MKRYNLINNSLGWLCFAIAAVTYLLTIEPTASFWDCPEFISQGAKLEVGHPPGNPIFMLAARFFITIFGGIGNAAVAVNSMSALLSAATILLLFWTITHLTRRLTVRDGSEPDTLRTVLIMGAGLCGALAYTWSDTFWFSAVEGEVYAFSSFCTALVFWLILKWENRADEPHSDRYLVLIAFVIGISIAVHLLNLLCIPAIALVFYYRKFKDVNVKGSLLTLLCSCAIVGLILYGLVPGFMKVAQQFELFFVNSIGLSYNSGVLIYAVLLTAVFIWSVSELYRQRSPMRIKAGFFLSILLSGIPFVGHGFLIPALLLIGLVAYLTLFCPRVPVRIFNVIVLSIFVIFIGYSSYALLLIRAGANTPMNQNAPDNVFALASYMSREQYGDNPLFYGHTFAEELETVQDPNTGNIYVAIDEYGMPRTKITSPYLRDLSGGVVDLGGTGYTPVVKHSPDEPDRYVPEMRKTDYQTSSDLNMLFTRMYSSKDSDVRGYKSWSEYSKRYFNDIPQEKKDQWARYGYAPYVEVAPYLNDVSTMNTRIDENGNEIAPSMVWKPSFWDNFKYFINYQMNHMYWRYFMWNFAGRQNDLAGNGEPHLGNWISGIPFIDNPRLGDQSVLPDEFGKGNKGHNVFYMLPLILGILGALWQALARCANGSRGIEQFWVVAFLFIMTGIAIILYLNQPPGQPRERDYAFAGSFYAFAIWIGMGVPAIYHMAKAALSKSKAPACDDNAYEAACDSYGKTTAAKATAAVAVLIGIAVPLQMVSQTWDDHDRSGRYLARDLGMNYLNSLDKDAIIFTYGDNDTFPLWYAQEVEGERTDVRVINLSYLTTDWYANQMRHPYYDAKAVDMYAQPTDYGYEKLGWSFIHPSASSNRVDVKTGLDDFYSRVDANDQKPADSYDRMMMYYNYTIPVDRQAAAERYGTAAAPDSTDLYACYPTDLEFSMGRPGTGFSLSDLLSVDIVANSFKGGHKRPVYYATTVPTSNYAMFSRYMHPTGMALEVTPYDNSNIGINAEKGYRNIMERFRWGGMDKATSANDLYLDETIRRMVASTRGAILNIANGLADTGTQQAPQWADSLARKNGMPAVATHADMAATLLKFMEEKMPAAAAPYDATFGIDMASAYYRLYTMTGDKGLLDRAKEITDTELPRFGQFARYASTLSPYLLGHLTSLDNYNLYALSGLLGLKNRIALREAIQDKAADEDMAKYVDIIDNIDDDTFTFYISRWLYVMGYGKEEFQQIYSNASDEIAQMAELAAVVDALHEVTGIDPMEATGKMAKDLGVSVEEIQRVFSTRVH